MEASARRKIGFSWGAAMALTLAALWLMGLGGGDDAKGPSIPIPEKNFSVTVTDAKGQTLKAKRFTWEGKVYFRGQLGSATVTLPFQKLKSLKVLRGKKLDVPDLIAVTAVLKTGESIEMTLDRTSKCYGETRFGDYEIFLKDVGEIIFN